MKNLLKKLLIPLSIVGVNVSSFGYEVILPKVLRTNNVQDMYHNVIWIVCAIIIVLFIIWLIEKNLKDIENIKIYKIIFEILGAVLVVSIIYNLEYIPSLLGKEITLLV